jgi:hypothetical protein
MGERDTLFLSRARETQFQGKPGIGFYSVVWQEMLERNMGKSSAEKVRNFRSGVLCVMGLRS